MKGPQGDRAGPIDWKGIKRKSTPIIDDRGAMYFQQNSRMSIANEIGRRHGMAQSNVPNAGAAVLGLATAWTPNGPVIVQQTISGGLTSLTGTRSPLPSWGDLALARPTGSVVPGGCTPKQTFQLNFTWTTSAAPNERFVPITVALPGSGCCYDVTLTVVNSLTDSGITTGAQFALYTAIGHTNQQLYTDCSGTLGNFVGTTAGLSGTASTSYVASTSHWISSPNMVIDGGALGAAPNVSGSSTVTLTITPNHACSGC